MKKIDNLIKKKGFLVVSFFIFLISNPILSKNLTLKTAIKQYKDIKITPPKIDNYGIAYGDKKVWIINSKTKELFFIDKNGGKFKLFSKLDIKSTPTDIDYKDKKIYINSKGVIYKLDLKTKKIEQLFKIKSVKQSKIVGIAVDKKYLYSLDRDKKIVKKYSLLNYKLVKTFNLYQFTHKNIRSLTIYNDNLAILDSKKDRVYLIDKKTGLYKGWFFAPKLSYGRGISYNDGKWWFLEKKGDIISTIVEKTKNGIRSNPVVISVTFNHTVFNNYPIKLKNIEIYSAIPPDTARQNIINFKEITKIDQYLTDQYGQKIGYYIFKNVKAESKVEAKWRVDAVLWDIRYHFDKIGLRKDIPDDIKKLYLKDNKFLNLNHPIIKKYGDKIGEKRSNIAEITRLAQVETYKLIRYGKDKQWDPAPDVIKKGIGSCSEYSFVITAFCRFNKIATKMVGATLFKRKKLKDIDNYKTYIDKIYHRWIEIYYPKVGWLPVESSMGDRDSGNYDHSQLFGYRNNFLVLSKGFLDSKYLGVNYHSKHHWSSGGEAKKYKGSVKKERSYSWKIY